MLDITVFYDEFELWPGSIQEVTFTDNLTGALDEVSVQIADPEHKWISGWVPKKNDRIRFEARLDGLLLKVPDFFVDSWDITTFPGSASIRALSETTQSAGNADSRKNGSQLRKKRTANHYNVTLRALVSAIAQRNDLKLMWQGEDTAEAAIIRQKNTSDLAFLNTIAQQTGRVCKLQNGHLIFIPLAFGGITLERFGDEARVVMGPGVRTVVIKPSQMTSAPKITHSGNVPDKKEFRRYQPISARLDRLRGSAPDETYDGGVNTGVNLGFGLDSACWSAALEAHLEGVKINFGVLPRVDIAAGSVVYLDEMGTYTGTYLIHRMTHKIGASGWSCETEAGRISAANITAPTKAQKWENRTDKTKELAAQLDEPEKPETWVLQRETEIVGGFLRRAGTTTAGLFGR